MDKQDPPLPLNLQFYCVNTSYPMDNMLNNYRLVGG